MFSIRRLHKWLFSCILVFSLTGVSQVHSYQLDTSVAKTELLVEQTQKSKVACFIFSELSKHTTEDAFNFKLFLKKNNQKFLKRYIIQNHKFQNGFNNYHLDYFQILSLVSCIDSAG